MLGEDFFFFFNRKLAAFVVRTSGTERCSPWQTKEIVCLPKRFTHL